MIPLTLINSLMLCFSLLVLCSLTTQAPTHHLTIGVQGNTPTLMVTSSEIGISPEMLNPIRKSIKTEYLTKPHSNLKSNEKHKSLKQKVHKNFSSNNKKEKLQYFAKPITKSLALGEATKESMLSLSSEDNKLKHFKESLEHEKPTDLKHLVTFATERRDKGMENISTVTSKNDIILKINLDSSSEQLKSITGTTKPTIFIQPNEEDDNKTTFKETSPEIKDIEVIPTLSSTLPHREETKSILDKSTTTEKPDIPNALTSSLPIREVKDKQTKTFPAMATTAESFHEKSINLELSDVLDSKQNNEISTTTNYAINEEIKSILDKSTSVATEKQDIPTALTTSFPIREVKHKHTKTFPAMTTTAESFREKSINFELSDVLGSKQNNEISTTTNYAVTVNTDPSSEALKSSSRLKGISTSEITAKQIEEETTTIKNENDNDRTTVNPKTLKNENLLTTSTPAMTKTFTFSPPPPPISFTNLIPDNARAATTSMPLLSISLTTMQTTTTASAAVDDYEQNATETTETATNMNKADNDVNGKVASSDDDTPSSIHGDNNKSVKFKQGQEAYEIAIKAEITPASATAIIVSHTVDDETMTTENPLPSMTEKTLEDFQTNALENEQSVIKTETDMETTVPPTTSIPFTEPTTTQQQQTTTEITMDSLEIKTNFRVNDQQQTSTSTEKVLKLIDLEKHMEASIDKLKQPTLTVRGNQDNGHDGLKNIKKKQLIDKHYIEDLLLNKHDDNHKSQNHKQEQTNATDNPSSSIMTKTTTLSPLNNAALVNHPLVPIKHGYLGPILMEEKTFHVIHHAANYNEEMPKNNQPLSFFETQLRSGHFVELKAKSEVEPKLETTRKPEIPKNSLESFAQSHDHQKFVKSSLDNKLKPKQSSQETNSQNFQKTKEVNYLEVQAKDDRQTIPTNTKVSTSGSSLTDFLTKDNQFYAIPQNHNAEQPRSASVLSSTLFQIIDTVATKTPIVQANTTFTSDDMDQPKESRPIAIQKGKTESKISDIQIEVYDSTIDSIVGSTNFKDNENNPIYLESINDEITQGKTTKPPVSSVQQEKFTQYVIDRAETSTQESINFSKIQVGSGKPEPAAIEIHINVSESFGNESEDLEFSYPQSEYNNERVEDESYDDSKVNDNIKLKVPSNGGSNSLNKDNRSDEILVVEIIDTDNTTEQTNRKKIKNSDDLFISDNTPPRPPPPPPYQSNFDRDSDTIFYISNTEVKVGESLANAKSSNEERKLKLESQFFPANYMASTHPNMNTKEDSKSTHHLYEEDIILSSNSDRNQADSLKIYRNRNEPSPPLDVTYVGESIIEVEQVPDSAITTTYVPDQQLLVTQQADVIIQPAILPEISIGVPVIGELPPQIELKEIDFMPNEAQLHRSGIYEENDSSNNMNNNNNNNIYNNDIEDNTINAGGSSGYSFSHDVDNNNNQRLDESSIQYGGDLIDESADGGFDGVEGSYPFGNPVAAAAAAAASSSGTTKTRKQQPNHVADYAHLYVNYGVNNMRKDELSADVKDSGEIIALGVGGGGGITTNVNSNEQNITSFKDFLNRVSMNNSSFSNINSTQSERMSNATAFSVMEDANDLQEKNTEDIVNLISLAIGLFIVILPIVVTCSMFWALRYLYKKYHSNITDSSGYSDQTDTKGQMNDDGVEKGELEHESPSSSPTNSNKDAIQKFPDTSNKPSTTTDSSVKFSTEKSTHLDQQTTSSKSGFNTSATKAKFSLQLSLALETHTTEIQSFHDEMEMPGPNGSITKMTLENNLLIVETEERNDISRVARETKMDYNKDGVFVVEVARGIDSKTIPESPVAEDSEKMLSMFETKHNNGIIGYKVTNEKSSLNNEKVQIHSPPPENGAEEGPRSLHQIEEVDEPINSPHFYGDEDADIIAGLAYKSNAGLSQSDLSTTSSNDSNKGYCYGNQALYVVEQNGYSTMSPTGNVVLKCDSKDIKDEDRNPENDHYLEHSPDKTEDRRDKEDFKQTVKDQGNSGKARDQGVSPRQQQNNRDMEKKRNDITFNEVEIINNVNIEVEQVNNSENTIDDNKEVVLVNEEQISTQLIEATLVESSEDSLPLALADLEVPNSENSLPSLPIESFSPIKSSDPQELRLCDATSTVTETSLVVVPPSEDSLNNEALPVSIETVLVVEESFTNENSILAVPEKFSDNCHTDNDKSITANDIVTEIIVENEEIVTENGFAYSEKIALTINGLDEKPIVDMNPDEDSRKENKLNLLAEDKIAMNGLNHLNDVTPLDNGLETLQFGLQQNGEIDSGPPSNTLTDMENGYDSIMSLPEPPPTTIEEQLNSDLSEQQLDSLPPPPPPEIFNLKDLPPPQINGDNDSLPSEEESNNFYNTLPPPPPTTLAVTATNGRMHASPLTPPASPPARFTNNLHAGLCAAQPIAVDVNGS